MPELAEVEIMRRNLEQWLCGAELWLEQLDPSWCKTREVELLQGKEVSSVLRRGKQLIVSVGMWRLLLHFRMTGKVVLEDSAAPRKARAVFRARENRVLFVDQRRFGEAHVLTELELKERLAKLGPEPWPEIQSGRWWNKRFERVRMAIKPALLNQQRVAGIGNILASEILFAAKISPFRSTLRIEEAEWEIISEQTVAVINHVIREESSAEIQFVHEGGGAGFSVYGKAGQPCVRCGTSLLRAQQAGRSTFWCASCQAE